MDASGAGLFHPVTFFGQSIEPAARKNRLTKTTVMTRASVAANNKRVITHGGRLRDQRADSRCGVSFARRIPRVQPQCLHSMRRRWP